jgi:hypothetical protein
VSSGLVNLLGTQVTGLGISALVALAFIRGWIVSARTLEKLLESYAARVAESLSRERYWREISELDRQRADTATRQVSELLETSRTSNNVITALRQVVVADEPEAA